MATNIYNPTTGQYGYQVPGATLQAGWQWGSAPATPTPAPAATPTVPTAGISTPNTGNTGSLPAVPSYTGGSTMPAYGTPAFNAQFGSSTPAPTPTTGTPAPAPAPTSDPTATSNEMLRNVLGLMKPSDEELGLSRNLANMEASRRLAFSDLEDQPIAAPFVTGQEAAVDKRITANSANTQGRLSLLQNQRLASLDAAKTAFEYSKPVTVGVGTNLVNPLTGSTVAQGQSYSAKLGYSTVAQLMKAYPDAGILPTDAPDAAAEKASNAPSFFSKNTSTVMKWDPSSGEFITYQSKSLPGASSGTGSTGGTNFGVSAPTAPSGAGIGGGSIVDYLRSTGQASDFNSRAGLAAKMGISGYTGTAQQNTQLLSMLRGSGGAAAPTGSAPATAATTSTASASYGNPFGLNPSSPIDAATLSYIQTGDMPSGIYPDQQSQIRARAQAVLPGFNPAIAKANVGAIRQQTNILANVSASIRTADANFALLLNTAKKAGINDNDSPIVNGLQNAIQTKVIGSGELNQFMTGIQTLRTEYAQVLARGGEVTEGVRHEAERLIPDNISLANLQKVYDYIKAEGQNVINERQNQIKLLTAGGGSMSDQGTAPGTYTSTAGTTYNLPY